MIDRLSSVKPLTIQAGQISKPLNQSNVKSPFSTMLQDAINHVNHTQNVSDTMTDKLIKGEKVELHNVMIAAEKASITLQSTLEIRNKVIEAYQEVMRMQV
ncbi:flagellar hook-basal body complex protein FliE [Bacillus timonensis]|nr:flagellar hook-basal body complex protein FliE [Bacillus timonensis]